MTQGVLLTHSKVFRMALMKMLLAICRNLSVGNVPPI